jgi:hypothetical protein
MIIYIKEKVVFLIPAHPAKKEGSSNDGTIRKKFCEAAFVLNSSSGKNKRFKMTQRQGN